MECSLKNITVQYEFFGEGKPIIMLPGWGDDSRFMAREMEPIFQHRAGWKRIYIDLPGHGKTPGMDWITNQDKMLDVVIEFIDKLISGQRFVVAGASLGAYLARGVVYHRARLIDGLLMIAPVIIAEDAKRTVPPHLVLVEDPGVVAQLEPAEAEMFEIVVIRSRKFLSQLRAIMQPVEGEIGDPKFLEKIRQKPKNYAFSFDVDTLSEPFPGPTLIITGRQDSVVGHHDAWRILENYPRATYVVLDRAGHWLEEKEDLVQTLVNDWLDRVEETVGSV